jgi:multidrug efflux pump subunit AcrB
MGVALADIQKELKTALGGVSVGGGNQDGRIGQVTVQFKGVRDENDAVQNIKLHNAKGDMVPLAALARVEGRAGPIAVERLDMHPMLEISGNPARGASLKDVRALCEKIAADEMGTGYRLVWLSETPR